MDDGKTLLDLTAADLRLMKIRKQFDELPQRKQLVQLRNKIAEVDAKTEQVLVMQKTCALEISKLQDEEALIKEKTVAAQAQIDKTINYKEVAAHTKEIEGFSKRLEKIEFETLKLMERSDKIAQVAAQVNAAKVQLTKQDEALKESFQKEGGILQHNEKITSEERARLIAKLPSDMAKHYERAREARGGFGGAHIEGTHCSGCHVELTEGQIAKLRAAGDIQECPHCHRLLVVDEL